MARSKSTNRNRRERERERAKIAARSAAANASRISPAQLLQNAEEILDAVRHALEDLVTARNIGRAKTAIRNFLQQGRSLTWSLEHLKRAMDNDAEWDEWWGDTTKALRADAAAQWFYRLRNPIVKEGHPVDIQHVIEIGSISVSVPPTDEQIAAGAPRGAVGFALRMDGMQVWTMPDGSEVVQPAPIVRRWSTLAGVPDELRDTPLIELMRRYLDILTAILRAAQERFGTRN